MNLNSLHLIENINFSSIQTALAQVGNWIGRNVQWINMKVQNVSLPEVRLSSPLGAAFTIVASDLLLAQLAYRIANLIWAEDTHVSGTAGNFEARFGLLFSMGCGLGIWTFHKVVQVPLTTSACVGLHVLGIVGGCILVTACELN
jgi:hypothetical protein